MIVLLSIKPKFVNRIFSGKKRFEYRKSIFRRPVTLVVVYASSPVSMVVGEFEIEELMHDELQALWTKTKDYAGITEDYYYSYFADKHKGYAIKVKNALRYDEPLPLKGLYSSSPPQSFAYITKFHLPTPYLQDGALLPLLLRQQELFPTEESIQTTSYLTSRPNS